MDHPERPIARPRMPRVPDADDTPAIEEKPKRLLSLDAYRGFIMVMLAASGFGIYKVASLPDDAPVWEHLDYETWQLLRIHFEHPEWSSQIQTFGVSFWDLIQPAFMFMVGVAMPFSYFRREVAGHSVVRRLGHALLRSVVLVLMGVFLSSTNDPSTDWEFPNVLAQIGLGYFFLYLLMGRRFAVQLAAFVLILAGYWFFFKSYSVPTDYDYQAVNASSETIFEGKFAPWSKNANAAHAFDRWFLNQFPRPEGKEWQFNRGGYQTLNFVPSIATMLLGVFCGQLIRSKRNDWLKFLMLLFAAASCYGLGLAAGETICPIVKRIWTPSWVLFSGGYVIAMLASFYFVFDLLGKYLFPIRWLAFPMVVVGMNSIAIYMMGQLMRSWTTRMFMIHFRFIPELIVGAEGMEPDMFGPIVNSTCAFVVFWLILFWMYRQKFFVRV